MGFAEHQGYCKTCNKTTLIRRQTPNHVLHLLLTLLLCAWWLPVWVLISIFGSPWRCVTCGTKTRSGVSVIGAIFLILSVLFAALISIIIIIAITNYF